VATTIIKVENYISKYSRQTSLQVIDILLDYMSGFRSDIYDTYSIDNYDDQGIYLGYTLEVTDVLDFKKIYTFNILERELKKMKISIN
jgi:hypothetical protein